MEYSKFQCKFGYKRMHGMPEMFSMQALAGRQGKAKMQLVKTLSTKNGFIIIPRRAIIWLCDAVKIVRNKIYQFLLISFFAT